jgi:hypothetical protein
MTLLVSVISASNLPNLETFGKSDPFCIIEFMSKFLTSCCLSGSVPHFLFQYGIYKERASYGEHGSARSKPAVFFDLVAILTKSPF